MDRIDVILFSIAAAPFGAWFGVTVACGLLAFVAVALGRTHPKDDLQLQALGDRRHGLLRCFAWVWIEGFWSCVGFALQGAHLLWPWSVRPPGPVPPGATPVVLVAGYLENSGLMWLLGRRLAARGHLVVHVDLPSTLSRISTNSAWLRARVDEVLRATGASRVALVGHSMGGVVSRTLVLDDPAAPVACVVSIASPHRGTVLGRLGPGGSARDMSPGSEHCLRIGHARAAHVPVHSIFGLMENIVSPAWSCVVAGGETTVMDEPCGHVTPLFLRSVEARVHGWLVAATVPTAQAAA